MTSTKQIIKGGVDVDLKVDTWTPGKYAKLLGEKTGLTPDSIVKALCPETKPGTFNYNDCFNAKNISLALGMSLATYLWIKVKGTEAQQKKLEKKVRDLRRQDEESSEPRSRNRSRTNNSSESSSSSSSESSSSHNRQEKSKSKSKSISKSKRKSIRKR